jgi:hypothetical protein
MFKKLVYSLVIAALAFSALGVTAGVALAKGKDPSNVYGCQRMQIKMGEKVSLFAGNAGVTMPSSGYAGELDVCRASGLHPQRSKDATLRLLRPPLWWTVDKHAETQDKNQHGSTFISFQLASNVPAAYKAAAKDGKLSIYRWNSAAKLWVKLPTTWSKTYNRATARATGFGYYAIAIEGPSSLGKK